MSSFRLVRYRDIGPLKGETAPGLGALRVPPGGEVVIVPLPNVCLAVTSEASAEGKMRTNRRPLLLSHTSPLRRAPCLVHDSASAPEAE
jgi:hypothetical protein